MTFKEQNYNSFFQDYFRLVTKTMHSVVKIKDIRGLANSKYGIEGLCRGAEIQLVFLSCLKTTTSSSCFDELVYQFLLQLSDLYYNWLNETEKHMMLQSISRFNFLEWDVSKLWPTESRVLLEKQTFFFDNDNYNSDHFGNPRRDLYDLYEKGSFLSFFDRFETTMRLYQQERILARIRSRKFLSYTDPRGESETKGLLNAILFIKLNSFEFLEKVEFVSKTLTNIWPNYDPHKDKCYYSKLSGFGCYRFDKCQQHLNSQFSQIHGYVPTSNSEMRRVLTSGLQSTKYLDVSRIPDFEHLPYFKNKGISFIYKFIDQVIII